MRKIKLAAKEVQEYLTRLTPISNKLYKTNTFEILNLKRNNFISKILYDNILEIIDKLDNNIYLFKYGIFEKNIVQPFFKFHTKKELKNLILLDKFDNYKYNTFGIRLEFIDTESNRFIYIIIIS